MADQPGCPLATAWDRSRCPDSVLGIWCLELLREVARRGTIGDLPPSDIDVPTSLAGAMVLVRTGAARPHVPRKNL
jgi:hypothetical protein